MKKIIAAALFGFAALTSVFAEGWSVHGYFRTGLEGNFDAKDVETEKWKDGKYYGNGRSRFRLNVGFDKDVFGFKMRYNCDGFSHKDFTNTASAVKDVWFNLDNLKYVMGYAKFLDGKIIAEAGRLGDSYTQSEGREEFNLCSYGTQMGYGVRAVVNPVDGLWLAAGVSTYRAEKYAAGDDNVTDKKVTIGDLKLNEKILSFSAKYKNDYIGIAGGYNLAGEAYGYFGVYAVKNLKLYVEGRYIDKKISGKKDKDGDDTADIVLSELINYNFKANFAPLEVGLFMYQKIVKDNTALEFYPHISYAFNDVINGECEVGIIKYMGDNSKDEITYNVTPSVKFKAGKGATVKVYYNYDKDDKSAVGATLRVNY